MRLPLFIAALGVAIASHPLAAQPQSATRTRVPLTMQASNTGDSFTYQKIEYLLLRDGSRVAPDNSADVKIDARSPMRGWSLGASNPTSVASAHGMVATDAVVRLRGREDSIECFAKVPAAYRAASKTVEVQLGDVKRFFDASGRAVAALCSASR